MSSSVRVGRRVHETGCGPRRGPAGAPRSRAGEAIGALAPAAAAAQQAQIVGKKPDGAVALVGLNGDAALKVAAKGAVGRAYGAPGDSVTHACTNPESTVTLTGGAGKTYRVACLATAWIRVGDTAAAAAPSTPVFGESPEYWTFTAAGGADPAVHCFAAAATTCIYTPMVDTL